MYIIGWSLLIQSSQASPVFRTICGRYAVDYVDVKSVIAELDDDYYLDNSPKTARGARMVLHDNNGLADFAFYLPWDSTPAANTACVSVVVNDAHTYNVKLYSTAVVNTNTINVHNVNGNIVVHQGPAAWDPSKGNLTVTTGTADEWNIAASAGFAMFRRSAGVTDETVDFNLVATGGSSYLGTYCGEIPCIVIDNSATNNHASMKYVPAHELGHFLGDARNGFQWQRSEGDGFDANATVCIDVNKQLAKKVHTSTGVVEGLAYYYAAVAFNNSAQGNCEYAQNADLNLNGVIDVLDNERAPSCQGELAESWSEQDFMGNHCGGTLVGRATQIDWMRAFWDADHDQMLSTTDIFSIYAAAGPDDWNSVSVGNNDAGDPKVRMESAAAGLSFGVQWNAVDDVNGAR